MAMLESFLGQGKAGGSVCDEGIGMLLVRSFPHTYEGLLQRDFLGSEGQTWHGSDPDRSIRGRMIRCRNGNIRRSIGQSAVIFSG